MRFFMTYDDVWCSSEANREYEKVLHFSDRNFPIVRLEKNFFMENQKKCFMREKGRKVADPRKT